MMGALSFVLMLLRFPLPFIPTFYDFDVAELPAVMTGFLIGPGAGTVVIVLKLLLKILIQGTSTAYVGEIANLIASLTLMLPAVLIYKRMRTKKGAVIALALASVISSLVSVAANAFVLLPFYANMFGWPLEKLIEMGTAVNPYITNMFTFLLFAVLPFNLLKCGVTALLTYILYKKAGKALKQLTMNN